MEPSPDAQDGFNGYFGEPDSPGELTTVGVLRWTPSINY